MENAKVSENFGTYSSTCFSEAPGKMIEILHVKGHAGNKGNERADKLAKLGSKLRHDIMVKELPEG